MWLAGSALRRRVDRRRPNCTNLFSAQNSTVWVCSDVRTALSLRRRPSSRPRSRSNHSQVCEDSLVAGYFLFDVSHSVIRDSSGSHNPAPDGDGMGVFASHDIRIVDKSFSRNGLGIHVEDSTNNLIKGNVLSANEQPGILMQADHNEMRTNRCHKNGMCIIVGGGNRNVIARNHVRRGHGWHSGREGTAQRYRPQRRRPCAQDRDPPRGSRVPHRRRQQRCPQECREG